MNVEIIGYLASFCSIVWSLPQSLKSIQTRSVYDISLSTTIIYLCSMALSLTFAFHIKSKPIILTNVIGMILFLPIIGLRISVDVHDSLRKLPVPIAVTTLLVLYLPTDGLGYAAGIINWWSTISQIQKSYITRSVQDISLLSISIRTIGLILWTTYSYAIWVVPLFIPNIVSLALAIVFISMKLSYTQTSRDKTQAI